MALVVVAYPDITQESRDWIDAIRARHDELYYRVIEPHFALLFPVHNIPAEDLVQHVRTHCSEFDVIHFELRCAICISDAFSDYIHVFLVPDTGFASVARLHDALYTGILAHELRLDIPFIPHIGVANSREPAKTKKLVDELNATPFSIQGTISTLDVASYTDNRVATIERVSLGPARQVAVGAHILNRDLSK